MSHEDGVNAVYFSSSELGTKDHWDDAYKRELKNFDEIGDCGEVWFGEDSMVRVLDWIDECDEISRDSSFLDLGTGNGVMLVELSKLGFAPLRGVDYSENAIFLAKKVAKDAGKDIGFEVADLLGDIPSSSEFLNKTYDVCLDKGTYDAISLNPDDSAGKREIFRKNLRKLLHPRGFFIITSCNWTEEELKEFFNKEEGFEVFHVISVPKFKFGGHEGSTTVSIIFRRSS